MELRVTVTVEQISADQKLKWRHELTQEHHVGDNPKFFAESTVLAVEKTSKRFLDEVSSPKDAP